VPARLLLRAGKRQSRQQQLNTLRAGGTLIVLKDDSSHLTYLVDTGASCSVLPHTSNQPPHGLELRAADGRCIPTWGYKNHVLNIGQRVFRFRFILAAVEQPILGNDFLACFRLLVDPARRLVLEATTLKPLGQAASSARASTLLHALRSTPASI